MNFYADFDTVLEKQLNEGEDISEDAEEKKPNTCVLKITVGISRSSAVIVWLFLLERAAYPWSIRKNHDFV